jgi:hypothetical protein
VDNRKKIIDCLLALLMLIACSGIGAAYVDSFGIYYPDTTPMTYNSDPIATYLGQGTADAMNQGFAKFNNWNGGYVSAGDNVANSWASANMGTASTSGSYDFMRKYIGNALVDNFNSHSLDPQPYWVDADTNTMSTWGKGVYPVAQQDAQYYFDKRWEGLGKY